MSLRRVGARGSWQTNNPFLFAVFHADAFPRGNGKLGPTARPDGSWQMYHGDSIPGFPHHPHRGFETLTLVLSGAVDHGDSAGNYGRYGAGDLQWMTAGSGLCHSEMFPLLNTTHSNPMVLFQIWLNLPAARKLARPMYVMQWAEGTPRAAPSPGVSIAIHAGAFTDEAGRTTQPAQCPPDSLAADPAADIAVWRATAASGASFALPAARSPRATRTLFVYHGSARVTLQSGQTADVVAPMALDLPAGATAVRVTAGATGGPVAAIGQSLGDPALAQAVTDGGAALCVLVLQGVPLDEPVVQRGPFVATTAAGIAEAHVAYQRGEFGRWPFEDDGPTFGGVDVGRFAVQGGKRDTPAPRPSVGECAAIL